MDRAQRLDMVEAYFSPGRGMMKRIARAARRRGARLILPALSDNGATIAAARLLYGPLLRRGVEIYEYQPCKLHMKLIVIDDAVFVGSANFDMRSLYLNLEMMLRIEDAGFARAMKDYFAHEWRQSTEISRMRHREAGWWLRLKWSAAYYVVAVMDYGITRRLNFGFR